MNFKKIVLITLLLLAVVTIGAVSAADDADVLAADDESVEEEVIADSVDENLAEADETDDALEMTANDFNLTIEDKKVDLNDANSNNELIASWDWPTDFDEVYDYILVNTTHPYVTHVVAKQSGETHKNLTFGELNIDETGTYGITILLQGKTSLVLGTSTLNVTKSGSTPASYTADDFIEIYDVSYNYPVDGPEGYVCTFSDSESGYGLSGDVYLYINGNLAYSDKFTGTGLVGSAVWGNNLTGSYNGIYTVKAVYKRSADGKEYYREVQLEFINVVGSDPIKTTISASDISTVYNVNKNLVATLKDNNGNPIKDAEVYISIMGVSYPIKTDKNGQIKQSLSSLPPKTHSISLTFKGDGVYAKSSKTVKVTVKKATPKLTAKAKTFKKSVKTKKYSVTLKNNVNKAISGAKVTIKVNKKSYTAKTNSKGVATFKITKLAKKGKYSAAVKYAGNSYYNAKSANVKITVK